MGVPVHFLRIRAALSCPPVFPTPEPVEGLAMARAETQRGNGEACAGGSLLSFRGKAAAVERFARAEKSKLSLLQTGEMRQRPSRWRLRRDFGYGLLNAKAADAAKE
jgi:hypothetical protein